MIESSGRMTAVVEVWPVAAEPDGLWLLDRDAWRSLPVAADSAPHIVMEDILTDHEVRALAPHSTSWRVDCDRRIIPGLASGEAAVILTYTVPVHLDVTVLESRWAMSAQPISLLLADAVGRQPVVAVTEAPLPRRIDVLFHGLRHLALLARGVGSDAMGLDAVYRAGLTPVWLRHLDGLEPALATLQAPRAA